MKLKDFMEVCDKNMFLVLVHEVGSTRFKARGIAEIFLNDDDLLEMPVREIYQTADGLNIKMGAGEMKLKDLFTVMDKNMTVEVHYVNKNKDVDFAIQKTIEKFAPYTRLLEDKVTNITKDKNGMPIIKTGGGR